ncbi:MAG TPA: RdgB/HAM1 family non-canonical purine NTP pyrophosphatase [Gemmatimonadales bacterium]|nr:RdgB/HAM1 family non-canonical purine NTP pyrophosphatase [Gemmatimonadales bacterium]
MRLLFATRSLGKQREVRPLLEQAGHQVLFPDEAGVLESPLEEGLELGDTFETNARRKAEYFLKKTGIPTVADDSGLEVLSLGGEPGVRSKRWANAQGSSDVVDQANNAELLRRLRGAPQDRRRARYRCVLVLLRTDGAFPEVFEGSCSGTILEEPRGSQGFGYDPLFLSDDLGKTFGEARAEEKDRISHRGRAVAALIASL